MKTKLFYVFLLLMSVTFIHAQAPLFEDNFETPDDNTALGTLGYSIWEGAAQVSDFAVDGIAAYQGSKFANASGTANKTFYLRKTVAVTAGKSYVLSMATLAPDAKLHKIGYKFFSASSGVVTTGTTNTEWQVQEVEFTATASEDVTFWVQFYGTGTVYLDNIKLAENTQTAIKEMKSEEFSIVKANENGLFRIVGHIKIADMNVFDSKGQLISMAKTSNKLVDLTNYTNGIYFLKVKDLGGNLHTLKLLKN